jgi:hypothetical protein
MSTKIHAKLIANALSDDVSACTQIFGRIITGRERPFMTPKPTFAYDLSQYISRNSQVMNQPNIQAQIENFMRDNGWVAKGPKGEVEK